MTPQAHSYELAKAFYMRALQVALRCATSLVARNQMQPVVMCALFSTQQRFSGCAAARMDESFGYLIVGSKPLKSVLLYHLSPPDWRYYFTGGEQAQLFDYLQTLHKGEDIGAFVARWKNQHA